jgi:hypothetical protein
VGVAWSTPDMIEILGTERIQETLRRYREHLAVGVA